jgi:hypothetical protein
MDLYNNNHRMEVVKLTKGKSDMEKRLLAVKECKKGIASTYNK